MIEYLGWAATAVFVASYFFSRPAALRGAQMLGALLWISYGLYIDALPVVVANGLVFLAAAWTTLSGFRNAARERAARKKGG